VHLHPEDAAVVAPESGTTESERSLELCRGSGDGAGGGFCVGFFLFLWVGFLFFAKSQPPRRDIDARLETPPSAPF